MPRGGIRSGAGRPAGSGVLDAWEKIIVAAECQRRWRKDYDERLTAAREAVFDRADYRALVAENLAGLRSEGEGWDDTFRADDLRDDIEGAIKEMAGVPVDDPAPARRVFHFQVKRPYRLKSLIITDVAEWASAKFGKPVSRGVVQSAWNLQRRVESDDAFD